MILFTHLSEALINVSDQRRRNTKICLHTNATHIMEKYIQPIRISTTV